MKRHSIALFLSSLALAGGTVACSSTPEAGEQGGDQDRQEQLSPPAKPKPAPASDDGGEGGED
jgi:hypothetical protein